MCKGWVQGSSLSDNFYRLRNYTEELLSEHPEENTQNLEVSKILGIKEGFPVMELEHFTRSYQGHDIALSNTWDTIPCLTIELLMWLPTK